jgi:hypothetical protein
VDEDDDEDLRLQVFKELVRCNQAAAALGPQSETGRKLQVEIRKLFAELEEVKGQFSFGRASRMLLTFK